MKATFIKYLQNVCAYRLGQRILVAVSSGSDSMALLHLCQQAELPVGVAHCNFKLRTEADEEELFIQNYCAENNIPFYVKVIPINQIKEEKKGQSTQMLARDLRYEWFEEIRQREGYHCIATAHHKNDLAETLINNLVRGSGIAGTHGIASKRDSIIRPLLSFSKDELLDYINEHKVPFREDASNSDTKYQRNFIRHQILPQLEKLNPNYLTALSEYAQRMEQSEKLLTDVYLKWMRKCKREENGIAYLNVGLLDEHPARSLLLYEMLKPFGFNSKQIQQIAETGEKQSGKKFLSADYRLMCERNVWTISSNRPEEQSSVQFADGEKKIESIRGELVFETKETASMELEKNELVAQIDKRLLVFPLTWRACQNGDYFYPLGLKKPNSNKVGKKKLSKYFKDRKFSQLQKEQSSVLVDAKGRIVWLVGQRLDDRFKISEQTKTVFRVTIQ